MQPLQRNFWFFIYKQASIQALSNQFFTSPALTLREKARQAITNLLKLSPNFAATLVWCPAHVGIPDKQTVDKASKLTITEGRPLPLPTSLASLCQLIWANLKALVVQPPSLAVLQRLRGTSDPLAVRKALEALPRPEATAIAQLRANHTPLSHFLHRIQALDSPHCEDCLQPKTTEHFLLLCRNFSLERRTLFNALRHLKIPRTTHTILTCPQGFKLLAQYVKGKKTLTTHRLPTNPNPNLEPQSLIQP